MNTYFKLRDSAGPGDVTPVFKQLIEQNAGPELERYHQTTFAAFTQQGNSLTLFLQPLTAIHLTSHLSEEIERNGDIQYIYLLGAVALFIIILACINFMNLSTARSANRAREVGVRKAVGAQHNKLVGQFLLESYLYTIVAVVLAVFIIRVALVPFNILVHKSLGMALILHPVFVGGLLVFIALVGLAAGSYPAFYLTSFAPAEVLKGRMRKRLTGYGIRNILVVFQFFISISLIIATLVVYKQLTHLQRVNLGFNQGNILNLLHTR
ncbi:MAG: FtsX-like permease family protein, partial [Bacteroidia bacterium]|nr:FtsX-like permease family protein [Bacteroidia bacterium]